MPAKLREALRQLDGLGVRPVVVASHPRSGTHLCIDTLRLNLPQCASWKLPLERADRLYLDLDVFCQGPAAISPRRIEKIFSRIPCPIIKTHAYQDLLAVYDQEQPLRIDPELVEWLRARATFLYTYRDGREAICSYYQLRRSEFCAPAPSLSEFLRERCCGTSRVKAWVRHVEGWMNDASAYCITMRELLHHAPAILPGVAERLGIGWEAGRTPVLPPKNGFELLSRMHRRLAVRPPSTAVESDPRHPTPNWRTAFTEADREFFLRESGDLLIRLGYEDSDHWADPRYDGERRYPALFALQQPGRGINPTTQSRVLSPSYSACYG
jgi:hypothetical protein